MKKLLIIIFVFSTIILHGQQIRILNTFYGFDILDQEIKIQIIEHDGNKGFLINSEFEDKNFLFMTDKYTYQKTINKNMINYKWFTWKRCAREMLIVPTTIFCVSAIDWDTGEITFTFNMELVGGRLNNYYIKFDRRELK